MKIKGIKSLVLTLALGVTLGLTSCNDKNTEHTHELKHVDAVSATCTEAGSKEYWACEGCDKLFADAEGTKETTVEELKIEALGHDFGEVTYNPETLVYEKVCSRDATHTEKVADAGESEEYAFQANDLETFKAIASKVQEGKANFVKLGDYEIVDVDVKNVTLIGDVTIAGNTNFTNVTVTGKLVIKGTTVITDVECADVLVKAGAAVAYNSTEFGNYPAHKLHKVHLEYDFDTKTSCTFTFNSGRIDNFTVEAVSDKTGEEFVQNIGLRAGYVFTSGSEWAEHLPVEEPSK